jgi:hypothetical protein
MNMKTIYRVVLAGILAAGLSLTADAAGLPDPLGLGQPGFFGRIEIGGLPRPPKLVFPEPVIIQRAPAAVAPQPVYLHVKPGHEKNWRKHCRKYNACGQPVYFVQDRWYNDEYVPEYRKHHGKDHGHGGDDRGVDDRGGDDRGGKHGGKKDGHGKDKD